MPHKNHSNYFLSPRRRASAVLAAGVAVLVGGDLAAQEGGKELAGLRRVPPDILGFVTVDHRRFRKTHPRLEETVVAIQKALDPMKDVQPIESERVTLVVGNWREGLGSIFAGSRPYDRAVVVGALLPGAKLAGEDSFYVSGDRALFFFSPNEFMLGPAKLVQRSKAAANGVGPPAKVAELAARHHAVGWLNAPLLGRMFGPFPPASAPLTPLLQANSVTLVLDAAETMKLECRVTFASESEARDNERLLVAGTVFGRMGLAQMFDQMGKDADWAEPLAMLRRLDAALKDASVRRDGRDLTVSLQVDADPVALSLALVRTVVNMRMKAYRTMERHRFMELGLAMHNYHDSYRTFPPPVIADKDGKPLLSWRVAILPFLEEGKLYREFRLDEPWDSEHNRKLLARMPDVFRSPTREAPASETFYQVFVGKGAGFEDGRRGTRINDLRDGTSNTIMVGEAARSVPWTKPEDLTFDPNGPLPKLGGTHGFNAVFFDGSARLLAPVSDERKLRSYITRAGREVIRD
jgi:hypothetical protein